MQEYGTVYFLFIIKKETAAARVDAMITLPIIAPVFTSSFLAISGRWGRGVAERILNEFAVVSVIFARASACAVATASTRTPIGAPCRPAPLAGLGPGPGRRV